MNDANHISCRRRPARAAIAVCAAALALVGAACGSSTSSSTSIKAATNASASGVTSPPPTLKPGVLQVVTNLTLLPWRYEKNGQYGGFEIALTDKIAHDLGFKQVTWANINWDSMMTAVAADKYDVTIAGINGWATPQSPLIYKVVKQRTQIVSFSRPYYHASWDIVSNKQRDPGLVSVADLKKGMTDVQLDGTTELYWAEQNLAPKGVKIIVVNDPTVSFRDVQAGLATSTIEESSGLHYSLPDFPELRAGDAVPGLDAGFSYAFAPASNQLRQAFNTEMGKLIGDGWYAQLFKKYFPWLPTQSPPAASFTHQ